MSISTKTGDQGATSLLYGKRVSKTDPRIACNGAVDELGAALGMARAHLKGTPGDPFITQQIFAIQKELVIVMGEIAVAPEDREQHKGQYGIVTPEMVNSLGALVEDLEKNHRIELHRWATPGETLGSAALDVARTVARRAECLVVGLGETDPACNTEVVRYLNRLSDLLWLWARWAETKAS